MNLGLLQEIVGGDLSILYQEPEYNRCAEKTFTKHYGLRKVGRHIVNLNVYICNVMGLYISGFIWEIMRRKWTSEYLQVLLP